MRKIAALLIIASLTACSTTSYKLADPVVDVGSSLKICVDGYLYLVTYHKFPDGVTVQVNSNGRAVTCTH